MPGSSVHGISQARILEWVAISFSRGSSSPSLTLPDLPGFEPASLALTGRFFTAEPPGKPHLSSDDTNGNQYTLDTFHMPGLHCFS